MKLIMRRQDECKWCSEGTVLMDMVEMKETEIRRIIINNIIKTIDLTKTEAVKLFGHYETYLKLKSKHKGVVTHYGVEGNGHNNFNLNNSISFTVEKSDYSNTIMHYKCVIREMSAMKNQLTNDGSNVDGNEIQEISNVSTKLGCLMKKMESQKIVSSGTK